MVSDLELKGLSVGLFKKKEKIVVCDMCGKADIEGCGSEQNHVVQISGEQPEWLPGNLRAQAQGRVHVALRHAIPIPR